MDSTTAYYWCAVCDQPILGDDIDARHWDDTGNDVHDTCCDQCGENNNPSKEDN